MVPSPCLLFSGIKLPLSGFLWQPLSITYKHLSPESESPVYLVPEGV